VVSIVCMVAAALVLAVSAYAWVTEKYVDAVFVPASSTRSTSGTASREWNRIWRPTPIIFCSHMPPNVLSYVCSYWDNPILDERNAFNSYGHCLNNDGVGSYPTTCQTTRPS
jgi:hypothetical protein